MKTLLTVIAGLLALVMTVCCSCSSSPQPAEAVPTPAPTPGPWTDTRCDRVGDSWSTALLCAVCDPKTGAMVYVVRGPDSVAVSAIPGACAK